MSASAPNGSQIGICVTKGMHMSEMFPTRRPDDIAHTREPKTFPAFPDPLNVSTLENWLEALHITPISATDWQVTTAWRLGPRVIRDSMFFMFQTGTARGNVEDQHFKIQPGDFMFIPKGASHDVIQDEGVEMRLSAVHFHPHVFGGLNLLDLLGFPVLVRPVKNRDEVLWDLTHSLNREYGVKAPGYQQAAAAMLMQMFLHIVRHFGSTFKPPYQTEKINDLRRLLPAFDHLERNLADGGISVGDMAKKVFVSEVQFRKLFRRVTGMSPVRYIQSRRIDRACRLLRESDMSIEQIAEAVGFADSPFFCRVFKGWTQATPAQYRQTVETRQ